MRRNSTLCLVTGCIAGAAAMTVPALAQSPKVGDPPEARTCGSWACNDLQARSAYQPTIHRQGDRWIAYIGHHGGTKDDPQAASTR